MSHAKARAGGATIQARRPRLKAGEAGELGRCKEFQCCRLSCGMRKAPQGSAEAPHGRCQLHAATILACRRTYLTRWPSHLPSSALAMLVSCRSSQLLPSLLGSWMEHGGRKRPSIPMPCSLPLTRFQLPHLAPAAQQLTCSPDPPARPCSLTCTVPCPPDRTRAVGRDWLEIGCGAEAPGGSE